MSRNGLDVSELTDFGQEIVEIATKEMPKVTQSFLRSEATKLKNRAVRKAKKETKTHTGNYINGFKSGKKVYPHGEYRYNIMVQNSAPHAHLIEHGHDMVNRAGQKVGTVPGKHILENSAIEFENVFSKDIETKLASKVIKEMER